jgi:hypothetical protein
MRILLAIVIMPVVLCAQVSFDPRRLDDSTALAYFYPTIAVDSGALMCTWTGVSASVVGAYGRTMTLDGNASGGMGVYDIAGRDSFPCPPTLTILHTGSGGVLHMIYHS